MNSQRENLVVLWVVIFMICAAIGYMWAVHEYWPNLIQAGIPFRFFVAAPSWCLFALAIHITLTKIK